MKALLLELSTYSWLQIPYSSYVRPISQFRARLRIWIKRKIVCEKDF